MLNPKQKIRHIKKFPDRERLLIGSSEFSSEKKIISLAKKWGRFTEIDGLKYILSPFKTVHAKALEKGNNRLEKI